MKYKLTILITFISFIKAITFVYSQSIPVDSLYLGQTPPGNTPKVFQLPVSSGFFSAERIVISPDGSKIYFSELNGYPPSKSRIWCSQYVDNIWNAPIIALENYNSPFILSDGKTMFCETVSSKSFISTKTDSTWSTPKAFLPGISLVHYLQLTNNGNYYLASSPKVSSTGDISELLFDGADTVIYNLGIPVNSVNNGFDFFISRDESYIVRVVKSSGGGNLFISYHNADGSWTNPKTLGSLINAPSSWEWGPYVTDDNKYLFFTRQQSSIGIYWVQFETLLDSLRHTNFVPYLKSSLADQAGIQDSVFNYQVPDSTFIDDDGNSTIAFTAALTNGGPLPAWLSFNPATRTFSGKPNAAGTYNIKVTATDTAKTSASCNLKIVVENLTGVKDNKEILPETFTLLQNYPNPFNPTTTIQYSITKPCFVRLAIYNMLGQEIRILQNTFQNAGEYSIVWDAADNNNNPVSSGVYLYRLESEGQAIQKEMVFIK